MCYKHTTFLRRPLHIIEFGATVWARWTDLGFRSKLKPAWDDRLGED